MTTSEGRRHPSFAIQPPLAAAKARRRRPLNWSDRCGNLFLLRFVHFRHGFVHVFMRLLDGIEFLLLLRGEKRPDL